MLEGTAVGEFFNSRRRFPCSILQIRIDRKGQARKGREAHLPRASQELFPERPALTPKAHD